MKNLFPLLLAFLLFKAVYSQFVVEGFVSDIKGKPITHAQVLLYSGSNIIAYAFVDSEGMFQVKTPQKGDFKLECTALGYEKAARYIKPQTDSSLNMPLRVDFVLKETAYQINEVIKYGDKPIVVKPDTVIYNVKSFVTGNERVVEDVLKKLPGINVDDNGKVTFKGKEVEKVMIEQNDFFGKGYKMITQNVQANAIEKVEAISNYSENPLLKGLSNFDKVALNLRLTDDAYKKIYTNLELGYSTINDHDAYLNLMNFSKKYSTLVFGNSSRLGERTYMGYPELVSSLSATSDDKANTTIPDYLINLEGFRPTLKRQRVNKLESNLGSLNEAINLSAKTKLTITSVYNQSNNWFTKNSIKKISYDTLSIVNSEIYNFSQNDKSALVKTKIESTPSSKSYIHHNLIFSGNVREALTQNNFNLSFVNEDVNAKSYYLNTNIDYTKKIYNQLLFQFNGAAYIGKNDEDYFFNPLPFTHVSDIIILNGHGSQKVVNDYNMIAGSSGIKLRISKFYLNPS